jgi:hypothetical protein
VLEIEDDVAGLQARLDASAAASGEHLRTAFRPSGSGAAAAMVERLVGILEVHLAVVTADGAPLVAPIDAILYRARFWIGIPPKAVRARLVRREPRVSASYSAGEVACLVHGTFHEPAADDERRHGFEALARSLYMEQYGDWFGDFMTERDQREGPGVTGWIEPRRIHFKG